MIHFDVQWQRCTNTIAPVCTDIAGATRGEYRLTTEDVGYRIRVKVWGDNEQGVTLAESNLTSVLTLHPPTNVIRPSIDGTLKVGKTVETNSGRWEFEGFIHFAYQWQRCDADGTHCVAIDGATKWSYKLTDADRGKRLVLAVWGDNGQGVDARRVVPQRDRSVARRETPAARLGRAAGVSWRARASDRGDGTQTPEPRTRRVSCGRTWRCSAGAARDEAGRPPRRRSPPLRPPSPPRSGARRARRSCASRRRAPPSSSAR